MSNKKIIPFLTAFCLMTALVFSLTGCEKEPEIPAPAGKEADHALLVYCAGFNNLSDALKKNLSQLETGYIPDKNEKKMLFFFTHFPEREGAYSVNMPPVLTRVYKENGKVVKEDILTMMPRIIASDAITVGQVFQILRSRYDIKSYGMIFSSHATGYLPRGYYSNEYLFESSGAGWRQTGKPISEEEFFRPESTGGAYPRPELDDTAGILTRSMGSDVVYVEGRQRLYKEMEISSFAHAIPVKLEYLLLDTCLMGGIETAYEFKDICRLIGFSQTEVLAAGMDYARVGEYLLQGDTYDIQKIGEDYIRKYMAESGQFQSATWSLVDCSQLEPLAEICNGLFEKYRSEIGSMDHRSVQRYFTANFHWFYDLESIIRNAGATKEELDELETALDRCVLYKDATPEFIGIPINEHSGFSMMLPSNAGRNLKRFYTTLQWNLRTGLVR